MRIAAADVIASRFTADYLRHDSHFHIPPTRIDLAYRSGDDLDYPANTIESRLAHMSETTEVRVASARWDDIDQLIGAEFVSDWLQVAVDRIEAFELGSYVDSNPNSVNVSLFPTGLVEGFHSLSLLDFLVNGVSFVEDDRWSGWNYGINRARFVSPITTSDRIRARGSIASIEPRGDSRLVTYRVSVEVEGREKPGLVAEWLVLWTLVTA